MTTRDKFQMRGFVDHRAELRATRERLREIGQMSTAGQTPDLSGAAKRLCDLIDYLLSKAIEPSAEILAFLKKAEETLRAGVGLETDAAIRNDVRTIDEAAGNLLREMRANREARTPKDVPRSAGVLEGTVVWFNNEKGFGFVKPDEGVEDLFIHRGAVKSPASDALRTGQKVLFEPAQAPRNVQASTIQAEPPSDMAEREAAMALPESTPAPREEKLHFVLQGDHVMNAAIVAQTQAVLEFRFGVPGDQSIGVVDSDRLDEARKADVDIELRVTPRGPVEVIGSRSGVAHFAQGQLLAPVRFTLKAGAASEDDASLHVDFAVKGEVVHQMELALNVVASAAQLDSAKEAAGTYDAPSALVSDAGAVGKPPRQRISLSLSIVGGKFCIEVTDLLDGEITYQEFFESKAIDRGRLEILLNSVRSDLGPAYRDLAWAQYDGSVPPPEQAAAIAAPLRRTVETVAVAGSRLNKDLRSDDAVARALQYIEDHAADGAVITVATDDVFIPWEILYPGLRTANMTQAQKDANPVEPRRFWGARFAIETVQRGTGSLLALRNAQLAQPPTVSINLNPTISMKDLDAARQPLAVQRAWARELGDAKLLDGVQDSCVDMRDVLQNAGKDATVIYLYCHGRSPNPFGGVDEVLELDDGCPLGPNDLDAGPSYRHAPIVVLNACEAGVYSALTFSSFLRAFRKRQALGLIATTFSIPIVFGAHFGQSLVKGLLQRKGSLAGMLLDLRREYLLERGNPVPLFYSVQCQMDYSAKGATP